MTCKNCKKEYKNSEYGLRSFCSVECKKTYRRKYKAGHEKMRRINFKGMDTKGGYVSINPPSVDNINPPPEPIRRGENRGHGLLKGEKTDYSSYGGFEWYQLAKDLCCNFSVRAKEGYCVTLAEPYFLFKRQCSDCPLGRALQAKYR